MRSDLQQNQGGKSGFRWGFLMVGILFVIVSVLSFVNPLGSLEAIAVAFAIAAVLNGLWLIVSNMGSALRIIMGVVNILVGVFIFANIFWSITALPYVFAVWFIADSLLRLFSAGTARLYGTAYFVFNLVFSILGIIIGVLLLFDPVTAVLAISFLVGFYLLLAGADCILIAFSGRNNPDY